MRIGVLLVSTGKYGIFLQPLLDGIEKYFFINNKIDIYLFSDQRHELKHSERINIIHIPTEHKPFPCPTLYRYKYFTSAKDLIKSDYLFYLDVDMAIVDYVDKEILNEGLTATLHPGFYKGGGAWGDNVASKSFTFIREKYYAGGFQGGRTKEYLSACEEMANDIDNDESKGIIAEWHDETHWNRYLSNRYPKTLTPEYCMVEQLDLRREWRIDHFAPKIIALSKDHESLR